jgi:hypothetical protein
MYYVAYSTSRPREECTTTRNPHKGYTRLFNLDLASSPQPQRGGLQSPNRTVTPTGTTLPCKAWSFTEGNTPGHHVCEYNQVFPRQPMKYEETHQCW